MFVAPLKLHGYDDMYLYVAGMLDPRVVQELRNTQENIADYRREPFESKAVSTGMRLRERLRDAKCIAA